MVMLMAMVMVTYSCHLTLPHTGWCEAKEATTCCAQGDGDGDNGDGGKHKTMVVVMVWVVVVVWVVI